MSSLSIAGLVLAVVGCLASLAAAVWLLVGFRSDNPRYTDDGMLYPGQQSSKVLPRLLEDQRKVAALAVVGAALQTLGAACAFIAASQ